MMEESEKLKTEENIELEEIICCSDAGTYGLPLGCSVLDLKDSANAAIAADPSFEVNGSFKKLCSLRKQQLPFVEEKKESEDRPWSWAAGTDGQLGTGRIQDEHLPQQLSLPSVSSLACGGAHVIALTSARKVLSWGRGNSGQPGHGEVVNNMYPKAVTSLDNHFITHVSTDIFN